MSDPEGLRAGVEKLIAEWRSEAAAEQRVSFCADDLEALLAKHPPTSSPGLSLSVQDDAFGITELLDDSTRERAMYHKLVYDIRKVLGDDGLHAQLLDLPNLIAQKIASPPSEPSPVEQEKP